MSLFCIPLPTATLYEPKFWQEYLEEIEQPIAVAETALLSSDNVGKVEDFLLPDLPIASRIHIYMSKDRITKSRAGVGFRILVNRLRCHLLCRYAYTSTYTVCIFSRPFVPLELQTRMLLSCIVESSFVTPFLSKSFR